LGSATAEDEADASSDGEESDAGFPAPLGSDSEEPPLMRAEDDDGIRSRVYKHTRAHRGECSPGLLARVEDMLTEHVFRMEARFFQQQTQIENLEGQVEALLVAQAARQARLQEHAHDLKILRDDFSSWHQQASPRASLDSDCGIGDGEVPLPETATGPAGDMLMYEARQEIHARLAENSDRMSSLEADMVSLALELEQLRAILKEPYSLKEPDSTVSHSDTDGKHSKCSIDGRRSTCSIGDVEPQREVDEPPSPTRTRWFGDQLPSWMGGTYLSDTGGTDAPASLAQRPCT